MLFAIQVHFRQRIYQAVLEELLLKLELEELLLKLELENDELLKLELENDELLLELENDELQLEKDELENDELQLEKDELENEELLLLEMRQVLQLGFASSIARTAQRYVLVRFGLVGPKSKSSTMCPLATLF